MILLNIEVEPGFRKADVFTLPTVGTEIILSYISKTKEMDSTVQTFKDQTSDSDLRVDYVQLRKSGDIFEIHCIVFPVAAANNIDSHVRVTCVIDIKKVEILETHCEQCPTKDSCPHIATFLFWLHRKSSDTDVSDFREFWGIETETSTEEEAVEVMKLRNIYACDEMRVEADIEAADVKDSDGNCFLENVLQHLENSGSTDCILYRHFRPIVDEFESIFIHHTLLDTLKNGVKDMQTLVQHMENQAKQGVFDRLIEASKNNYKSSLWLEAQYMRLRCSLIHRIASRKDQSEDEQILELLFSKEREETVEERQQLKQHKRFILKQTEKLENKVYLECGLLLSESYPYICASPDGITDDHIVEIKAPKTDEEFERYLEYRETIAPKYMAQIQIQMYMANVTRALYCVLSPTFDTNGALHYVWVQADMEFVASLLSAAEDFWREVVFPRLEKIYLASS